MPVKNNWKQRWTRLAAMSGDELLGRSRQEVWKRLDLLRYRMRLAVVDVGDQKAEIGAHFFFDPQRLDGLISALRERLPEKIQLIVQRAERICEHRFDLLGYENIDYGRDIDWHCDRVHGKRAPLKPWFKIRYLDFCEAGDVKVIWELNRHQHLVTLAKAYRITNEERYAAELFRQWYDWQAKNPYPMGVNWASSLEVAFRSLSWLWVCSMLENCPVVPRSFSADLLRSLEVSAHHIERYLSTYFSPNTHLLGEGVALFFIGTLCPELKRAACWQQRGWKIILGQAEQQVLADGMYYERSLYYHVYALDFFLHSWRLAVRNGLVVPQNFLKTIEKMLEVLALLSRAGALPSFGDDDGGRLFDPRRNSREHMCDPLVTGAVLLGRGDFKACAGELCEEAVWLLGAEAIATFDRLSAEPAVLSSTALPDSGLYIMGSDQPREHQLIVDAGSQGTAAPGHGHADALSVQLISDGRPLLVDTGTCEYVGPEGKRKWFRGTAAHNTLRVDGLDQSESQEPFIWKSLTKTNVELWSRGQKFDFFRGSHDGYQRLELPVVHRRSIFHRKSFFWMVHDQIDGKGSHKLDVAWHLGAGLVRQRRNIFMAGGQEGGLFLVTAPAQEWRERYCEGHWSPVYGQQQSLATLHFERETALPAELAVVLLTGQEAGSELGELAQLRHKPDAGLVSGYCYSTAQEHHTMFFNQGTGPWCLGKWSSDAVFLYHRHDQSGVLEILFCQASYVEFDGRRIVSAREPVSCCELVRGGQGTEILSPGGCMVLHEELGSLDAAPELLRETVPSLSGTGN